MRVSVVVSILNGVRYIERFVDTLRQQTFQDFETIFVVDSKSSDGSMGIVNDYAKKLTNSYMVIQDNDERLGGSRNIGLDHAKGELIWFADVDDVINKEFLDIMVRIIDDYDADISVCNFTYSLAPKVRIKEVSYSKDDITVMSRLEALIAKAEERIPIQVWSKVIRRGMLTEHNLRFDKGFAEDIKFTYKILSKAKKVCYYNKSLYSYQQNAKSIIHDNNRKDLRGREEIDAYNDLEEYFKDDEFFDVFRRTSTYIRIRSAGHMSMKGFLKYHKSEEAREMYKRNIDRPNWDTMWFFNSPRTYYLAEQVFFKLYYYRDGKDYS